MHKNVRSWQVKKEGYCGLSDKMFVSPSEVGDSTINGQVIGNVLLLFQEVVALVDCIWFVKNVIQDDLCKEFTGYVIYCTLWIYGGGGVARVLYSFIYVLCRRRISQLILSEYSCASLR